MNARDGKETSDSRLASPSKAKGEGRLGVPGVCAVLLVWLRAGYTCSEIRTTFLRVTLTEASDAHDKQYEERYRFQSKRNISVT
jgi:hypothetical protein